MQEADFCFGAEEVVFGFRWSEPEKCGQIRSKGDLICFFVGMMGSGMYVNRGVVCPDSPFLWAVVTIKTASNSTAAIGSGHGPPVT